MIRIDRELDRALVLLRNKIRDRGVTQLEIQEALGWGRSYISQLLTKQKALRVEQLLLILHVIGVHPTAFFSELYGAPTYLGPTIKAKRRRRKRSLKASRGFSVTKGSLPPKLSPRRSKLRGESRAKSSQNCHKLDCVWLQAAVSHTGSPRLSTRWEYETKGHRAQ